MYNAYIILYIFLHYTYLYYTLNATLCCYISYLYVCNLNIEKRKLFFKVVLYSNLEEIVYSITRKNDLLSMDCIIPPKVELSKGNKLCITLILQN